MKTDPVTMEILRNLVISIAEEMGVLLKKSAHSPNIKERMDASCALFDSRARLIAQADHIPVHLGSMPEAVHAVLNRFPKEHLKPGDQFILNDPFEGGTHLPDISIVMPVFLDALLIGYAVNKAHHSDVGGITPCSMPANSSSIHEEGLLMSPTYIKKMGDIQEDVMKLILSTTRTPHERIGDLNAQLAANERGAKKFASLVKKYSFDSFSTFANDIIEYSRIRVINSISKFISGTYSASEFLELDLVSGEKVPLQCKVIIKNDEIHVDFEGTSRQVIGNVNAPLAVTKSAVYYVFRCLTDPEIPPNHGSYLPITIFVPQSCLLNPDRGCAVAAGNVETSQRIVDLLFKAIAPAAPGQVPAQSQGTMNNITFGGVNRKGETFTYYETIGGGEGALPFRNGQDGIHTHMTNTANTPVEVIEERFPLRVLEYSLRDGSQGLGRFKGGMGLKRKIQILTNDVSVQIISERRLLRPAGAQGGKSGSAGKNRLIKRNQLLELPSKVTETLNKNDIIEIFTPGGGGYGRTTTRD